MFYFNLIKYYFAFKTRLTISDQKLPNFAECIAGKGKFCGRKLRKKLRGQALARWSSLDRVPSVAGSTKTSEVVSQMLGCHPG